MPPVEDPAGFRGFVAHLLGDQVKAALAARLERESEGQGLTLTAEERAKQLEALHRKIRTAAAREEVLVVRLEAAHFETLRRQDADPEIVLCLTLDGADTSA